LLKLIIDKTDNIVGFEGCCETNNLLHPFSLRNIRTVWLAEKLRHVLAAL